MAPTATYSVVLGVDWLLDHDPIIHWGKRILTFQSTPCISHTWNDAWGLPHPPDYEMAGLTAQDVKQVPSQYHDLLPVFEETEAELPPHRDTDSMIDIILGEELPKAKLYPMSQEQKQELRNYIDKNLAEVLSTLSPLLMLPQFFHAKEGWGSASLH